MELIDKNAVIAEIKGLIRTNELYLSEPNTDEIRFQKVGAYSVLNDLLHFIDTLEAKEVDLETDIENEYIECNIDIFNRKFPNLPKLNGQYLHDYKNFLNTCKQIFRFHYWNNHPTQEILFEKLSLLWATWGAQHLKNLFEMNSEGLQKMDVEVKDVDLEKEIGKYLDANDIEFSHQIKLLDFAKHFFELGKAKKGE